VISAQLRHGRRRSFLATPLGAAPASTDLRRASSCGRPEKPDKEEASSLHRRSSREPALFAPLFVDAAFADGMVAGSFYLGSCALVCALPNSSRQAQMPPPVSSNVDA